MEKERFIKLEERTTFEGIEIECKPVTNDEARPCTMCLIFKMCTEKHLLRNMCFGHLRPDRTSVYFGKPNKYNYDIHR